MILLEDVASGDVIGREARGPVARGSLHSGDAVEEDVAVPFHEVGRNLMRESERLPTPLPLVSSGQPAENERGNQSPHLSLWLPSWSFTTLTQSLQHLFML